MTNTNRAESLTINGITYLVVSADTPETAAARGLSNVAANMRERNVTRQLGLQRPRSRGVVYFALEYAHPVYGLTYSDPMSLGGGR